MEVYFFTILEALEVQDQGASMIRFCWASLLGLKMPFPGLLHGEKKGASCLVSCFIRALIPSWEPHPYPLIQTITSHSPHLQILSCRELGLQHMNLEGDTNTPCITMMMTPLAQTSLLKSPDMYFISPIWYLRFLRWLSGKESTYQYNRHGFDPWVKKIPWRRKLQPTPVLLPGKSHRQRNLQGYSPWSHRVRRDWATEHAHTWHLTLNRSRNKFLIPPSKPTSSNISTLQPSPVSCSIPNPAILLDPSFKNLIPCRVFQEIRFTVLSDSMQKSDHFLHLWSYAQVQTTITCPLDYCLMFLWSSDVNLCPM